MAPMSSAEASPPAQAEVRDDSGPLSSQAGLLNEISRLGTNLLTVANGQTRRRRHRHRRTPVLAAPGMISRITPITAVDDTGHVGNVNVLSPNAGSGRTDCRSNGGGERLRVRTDPAIGAGTRVCRSGRCAAAIA